MQNKGAEVSIAIPKAQQPKKFERVSPGVYRGPKGDLKRSASNPSAAPANRMPGNTDQLLRNISDMLKGANNPLLQNPSPVPVPKILLKDIDPGFEVRPDQLKGSLYDLARSVQTSQAPQIPRSGSISDLLRGR
jgi:hypothetical protein